MLWWSSRFSLPAQIIYVTFLKRSQYSPFPLCGYLSKRLWLLWGKNLENRYRMHLTWCYRIFPHGNPPLQSMGSQSNLLKTNSSPWELRALTSPFRAVELVQPKSKVGVESGGMRRAQGIGILFKVAWISLDSSMAPFINVNSARVSVGRRLRLVLGGRGWVEGVSA